MRSSGTLAGAIIAVGRIEVDQNRQVVQHPDGGVVAEILVDEGDTVATGDTLLRLDDTLLRSELAVIENQLFELNQKVGSDFFSQIHTHADMEPEGQTVARKVLAAVKGL